MKEKITYLDENNDVTSKVNAKYFIYTEEESDGKFRETFGKVNLDSNKKNIIIKYVDDHNNEVSKEKANFMVIQELVNGNVVNENKSRVNL